MSSFLGLEATWRSRISDQLFCNGCWFSSRGDTREELVELAQQAGCKVTKVQVTSRICRDLDSYALEGLQFLPCESTRRPLFHVILLSLACKFLSLVVLISQKAASNARQQGHQVADPVLHAYKKAPFQSRTSPLVVKNRLNLSESLCLRECGQNVGIIVSKH
eukprot:348097-Amphidinium_carterae.1